MDGEYSEPWEGGSGGEALSSRIYETEAALTANERADVDGGSSKLMITQEL
jgi:hypothetical protein